MRDTRRETHLRFCRVQPESELREKQLRVNEQIHAMRDMAPGEWKVAKQQVVAYWSLTECTLSCLG